MSDGAKAVFLSYASQDKEAARKICEALRAAGLEVWFDENELRGGDAWDQKIRKQIKECALFVPLITPNTNARPEGYFRLEWKLAVDRSHLMADDVPFLFPIVVGDVSDASARVPDKFRDVQWTRLRIDETPDEIAGRVSRLLSGSQPAEAGERSPEAGHPERRRPARPAWLRHSWSVLTLLIVGYYALRPLWRETAQSPERGAPPPVAAPVPVSEARQLAERGFALSVDNFDSTQDDFAVAEDLLKRALALDPDDGEIWAYSAQLNIMFRNRGFDFAPERIATGRQQAERAVRLAPDSPEAVFAVALANRYTNNNAGYHEALRRVVALNPAHARALMFLAAELTREPETLAEGLALLARARENAKWAPLVDYFEFLRAFTQRRFADAETAIRRSQEAKPSANSAAAIAALHLTWQGDLEATARLLAELPPALLTAPRVIWATAELHLVRRDPERALRTLDRLPDEFLSSSLYTGPKGLLVGRAHALAGREAAARIDWEKALLVVDQRLKAEPGDALLHRSRGEILASLGRVDEALAEARTVSEINRGRTTSWQTSEVTIYAALGRADLAAPLLEEQLGMNASWPLTARLLRLDPRWDKLRDDAGFQQRLAEAEAKEFADLPPRDWPKDPEVKKAFELITGLDASAESCRLAEDMLDTTLKQRPTDAEATVVTAMLHNYYLNRGYDSSEERLVLARRFAERAVQLAPEEPEALAAMAQFLSFRGSDYARAEELIHRAMLLVPQEPRIARIMPYNVLRFTDPDRALQQAKLNAVRFPQDALVHYDLALIARGVGELDLMEQALDRTIAITPLGSAMIWKGWLAAWVHGDLPGFKRWLDRISGNFRFNERAIYMRYLYACLSGDIAYGVEAVRSYTGTWMNDYYYTGPRSLLAADLLATQGKGDLAREEYGRALAEIRRHAGQYPNDTTWERAEFWALQGVGREVEAREAAKRILDRLRRPYRPALMQWWHDVIPIQLLAGDRASALALIREAARAPAVGAQILTALRIDRRMAVFRDDPEIKAILGDASAAKVAVRDWPKNPDLKRALELVEGLETIPDDLALAEQIVRPILDRSPADLEVVTVMARIQSSYLRRGFDRSDDRFAQARVYAERAMQLGPDEPEAMLALATYLFSRATSDTRTERLLRRAMELDPGNPRHGRLLADLFNVLPGRQAEAIAQSQDNVRRFPRDVLSHYDLARHYKDQGRYEEFDRELDATLALAPLPNAIVWKARLEFGLRNDFAGMKAWLDRVPERVRSTERAVFGYFLYAAFGGDPEAGLEALRGFTQKWFSDFEYSGPTALLNAALLEVWGKKELARQQYEVALLEIQRMRATDPARVGLSQVEFWTLFGLGRLEEARVAQRRIIEGLRRPYGQSLVNGWWFSPIPGALLSGERATALELLRESVTTRPESRAAFRLRLQLDPRMAPFRDDAEIKALLADPAAG